MEVDEPVVVMEHQGPEEESVDYRTERARETKGPVRRVHMLQVAKLGGEPAIVALEELRRESSFTEEDRRWGELLLTSLREGLPLPEVGFI